VSAPVVVLGPTASGKSDVAMALAEECNHESSSLPIEIVAVDAMQVYRRMDIGTAKPSAADQSRVAHHCIDLVDADCDFTVADFTPVATAAIAEIEGRRAVPLVVAGTGLYLRMLTDPMEIPGEWPEVRVRLERRLVTEGPQALHAELSLLDPVAAAKIEPANGRRTVRALEVCLGSKRLFSSFGPGLTAYGRTRFRQFGLRWSRDVLAARIATRVHSMMAAGLLDEVAAVRDVPGGMSRTAQQALGYKELIDHLDGRCSLDGAVEQVIVRTRQFAVRQERWFRRDPRIQWIGIDRDPVGEAVRVIRRAIAT
jgi:tRNA dimethylallyltransferase